MNVRKFRGATAREVLRKVKETLGPDALILSNRPVADGVEITAIASAEEVEFIPQQVRESPPPQKPVQSTPVEMAEVMEEIRRMRSLLEEQLAGFAWSDLSRREPMKLLAMKKLLGAGFSPKLSRQMTDKMPNFPSERESLEWLKTAVGRNVLLYERHGFEVVEELVLPTTDIHGWLMLRQPRG